MISNGMVGGMVNRGLRLCIGRFGGWNRRRVGYRRVPRGDHSRLVVGGSLGAVRGKKRWVLCVMCVYGCYVGFGVLLFVC